MPKQSHPPPWRAVIRRTASTTHSVSYTGGSVNSLSRDPGSTRHPMFGDAEQRTGMADCFPSDWSPLELFWNATMHHETPAETLFGGETRSGDDGLLKRPTNSSLLRTYAAMCASPGASPKPDGPAGSPYRNGLSSDEAGRSQ